MIILFTMYSSCLSVIYEDAEFLRIILNNSQLIFTRIALFFFIYMFRGNFVKCREITFFMFYVHRALCLAGSNQTQTVRVYHNADSSPSKHEDLTRCCFNVGPAPLAVGQ